MKRATSAPSPHATPVGGILAGLAAAFLLSGCPSPLEPGTGAPPSRYSGMPGQGPGMMMGGPGMMGRSSFQRHRQAMMAGVPAPYQGLSDPLPTTQAVVAAGKELYAANCASCHGTPGEGNGPAAAGLSPPPANLQALMHSPLAQDDYLMWAISAGGAEYGTGMPAFKDALAADARWKIIRYLRTL